jgi:hypothetical protein
LSCFCCYLTAETFTKSISGMYAEQTMCINVLIQYRARKRGDKMKIKLTETSLTVTAEKSDPKFYNSKNTWGSAESRLLHYIKKALIAQGHDVIKKRMQKDGHMVGNEETQYIRSRKIQNGKPYMMIYDGMWAIRQLQEEWNDKREVTLLVVRGIGE